MWLPPPPRGRARRATTTQARYSTYRGASAGFRATTRPRAVTRARSAPCVSPPTSSRYRSLLTKKASCARLHAPLGSPAASIGATASRCNCARLRLSRHATPRCARARARRAQVPLALVVGKASTVLWPPWRWGRIVANDSIAPADRSYFKLLALSKAAEPPAETGAASQTGRQSQHGDLDSPTPADEDDREHDDGGWARIFLRGRAFFRRRLLFLARLPCGQAHAFH